MQSSVHDGTHVRRAYALMIFIIISSTVINIIINDFVDAVTANTIVDCCEEGELTACNFWAHPRDLMATFSSYDQ